VNFLARRIQRLLSPTSSSPIAPTSNPIPFPPSPPKNSNQSPTWSGLAPSPCLQTRLSDVDEMVVFRFLGPAPASRPSSVHSTAASSIEGLRIDDDWYDCDEDDSEESTVSSPNSEDLPLSPSAEELVVTEKPKPAKSGKDDARNLLTLLCRVDLALILFRTPPGLDSNLLIRNGGYAIGIKETKQRRHANARR